MLVRIQYVLRYSSLLAISTQFILELNMADLKENARAFDGVSKLKL